MRTNIYENKGNLFIDDKKVEEKINSRLYNTSKVKIKVIPTIVLDDNINIGKDKYLITEVSTDENCKDEDLKKAILDLNTKIEQGNRFDRKSWQLFYLFKEIITMLKTLGYNYFRGQQQDWITKPAIFRNYIRKDYVNENKQYYFNEFERLYKEICHEFPDELKYIEYPKEKGDNTSIQNRANSLSILQHYGIPTSLLDITENPFVALLFMFGTDKPILNPQFESYQIYEEHESKSIVSFVDKTAQNKRIKAQNGAFLNYDKLEDIMQITDDDFQIDLEYCPINRVIINVEIEKDYTIKYLKKVLLDESNKDLEIKFNIGKFMRDINIESLSTEDLTFEEELKKLYSGIGDYNKRFINDYITILKQSFLYDKNEIEEYKDVMESKSDEIIKKTFINIKNEMILKLEEYNYLEKKLYPDFVDYLRFKNNEYALQNSDQVKKYKINKHVSSDVSK